jgi:hypothetical protein
MVGEVSASFAARFGIRDPEVAVAIALESEESTATVWKEAPPSAGVGEGSAPFAARFGIRAPAVAVAIALESEGSMVTVWKETPPSAGGASAGGASVGGASVEGAPVGVDSAVVDDSLVGVADDVVLVLLVVVAFAFLAEALNTPDFTTWKPVAGPVTREAVKKMSPVLFFGATHSIPKAGPFKAGLVWVRVPLGSPWHCLNWIPAEGIQVPTWFLSLSSA